MIYNVTYKNRNIEQSIDDTVGKPFSLIDRFKQGGVGSERFKIVERSESFDSYTVDLEDENYCNIELRPNGIIVHFSRMLERFAWVIPFYELTIYQSGRVVSIYQKTEFMKMQPQGPGKSLSSFIQKVLLAKGNAMNQSQFY